MNGGFLMMWVNLFWVWGYLEVYIVILLVFGIFLEIIFIFLRKKLFGYLVMVVVMVVIFLLSFLVWVYYFFIMGLGVFVNFFFFIIMMMIVILIGIKIFNWFFMMYKG